VQLGASVGIASNETAGHSAGELLRGADVAMYLAKSRGKGRFERYEAGMNAAVFERLEMKHDLVRAMADTEQIFVVYQPVVDLSTGEVVAVEALLRWTHPTRGAVPPAAFIPLAEETGLIHPLGLFVLDQACGRLGAWMSAGHALDVHVNVSVRQLEDERFAARFAETIASHGLPLAAVVLELTESIHAAPGQHAVLEELHRQGVRIAIDDFGTGYAGWGYLADLPVDILKLDRSFVSCLGSEQTLEVVRAIIDVARANGVVVVAEGVEPEAARAAASSSGGRLDRARLLAGDAGFASRQAFWRRLPDALDGTGATVATLVDELQLQVASILEPLARRQAAELDELDRLDEIAGRKRGRKDVEDRHKREVRRVRTDELQAGLATLAGAFRDRLAEGRADPAAFAAIRDAEQHLVRNPNEALLLAALLLRLSPRP